MHSIVQTSGLQISAGIKQIRLHVVRIRLERDPDRRPGFPNSSAEVWHKYAGVAVLDDDDDGWDDDAEVARELAEVAKADSSLLVLVERTTVVQDEVSQSSAQS